MNDLNEKKVLDEANPMIIGVVQMYDYVRVEVSLNVPYQACFYVNLSDSDIDWLIINLQNAKLKRNTR